MSDQRTTGQPKDLAGLLDAVAAATDRVSLAIRSGDLEDAARRLNRRQEALADLAAAIDEAPSRLGRALRPRIARAAHNAARANSDCIEVARRTRDDVVKRLIDSHSGMKVTRAYRTRPPMSAQAISAKK
ncbi:MAG: hypothetical protein ACE5O2_10425 [Armatimonadota bacterium]